MSVESLAADELADLNFFNVQQPVGQPAGHQRPEDPGGNVAANVRQGLVVATLHPQGPARAEYAKEVQ